MKDLCVKESYEKNGETKTSWNKIGILIESGDKQYIKLYHMPGVLINVFEQKDKKQTPKEHYGNELTQNMDEVLF